jgi:hypothetical protein
VQTTRVRRRMTRLSERTLGDRIPKLDGTLRESMATTTRYEDCLTASWLAVRLGIEPMRIDAMRRAGELIAVREPGSTEWLYPPWQFSGLTPRRAIRRIVSSAREIGLDETRLYDVLTAPLGLGGRRRLVDLLLEDRDEEVVEAVRSEKPL